YASTFRFCGDFLDTKDSDIMGRCKTRIIAMDALSRPGKREYGHDLLLRKVYGHDLLLRFSVFSCGTEVSNDPAPSEDSYCRKRMAAGSKRVGIPFSFSQPSPDDGKGTVRKRSKVNVGLSDAVGKEDYNRFACRHYTLLRA
ncbi:poly(ADP-ribose) glycohydrolase 1-like protein, partial [Tanacetum coccineum]